MTDGSETSSSFVSSLPNQLITDDIVKQIGEILLYTELLSVLVSRDFLNLATAQLDDEIVSPPEPWTAIFPLYAQFILHELGEYLGYSPPPL